MRFEGFREAGFAPQSLVERPWRIGEAAVE
jgi:hypothetical protein